MNHTYSCEVPKDVNDLILKQVFNNCYGQVAYRWQLSQKAYVLDNVANNYYMTAVISNHIRNHSQLRP